VIEKGKQEEGDLKQAIELLQRHGALEATRAAALGWAARARAALEPLPDGELRDLLSDLADYVVARVA
jgi:octaprenyl-diphosphate synthase